MKMHKCSDKKMQLIFFFNLKYTCYLETLAWVETAVALLMSIDGSILIAHSWWEVRLGANAGAKTSGIVLKHAGSGAGWCFLAKQSKIRTLCPSRCPSWTKAEGTKMKEERRDAEKSRPAGIKTYSLRWCGEGRRSREMTGNRVH